MGREPLEVNMDAHWLGPLGMPTRHIVTYILKGELKDILIINGFQYDQTIPK